MSTAHRCVSWPTFLSLIVLLGCGDRPRPVTPAAPPSEPGPGPIAPPGGPRMPPVCVAPPIAVDLPENAVFFCDQVIPKDAVEVVCRDIDLDDLSPLRGLSALQRLEVRGIGVTDLSPVERLTALRELELWETNVSSLEPLRRLDKLTRLVVFGVGNETGPDQDPPDGLDLRAVAALPLLEELNLNESPVDDLSPLKGLSRLRALFLGATLVEDLSPLAALGDLERLDLHETNVTDLSPLVGLTRLEALDLRGTPVADLAPIKGLRSLRALGLSDTGVTDLSPVRGLKRLTRLTLRNVTPKSFRPLAALRELRSLTLSDAAKGVPLGRLRRLDSVCGEYGGAYPDQPSPKVPCRRADEIIVEFEDKTRRIPFCGQTLASDESSVTCRSPEVTDLSPLNALREIDSLDLSGTGVESLALLKRTGKVRALLLTNAPIEDIGALCRFTSLVSLSLNGTAVRDLTPLRFLTDLEWHLDLSATPIADIVPLADLTKLEHLNLGETKITSVAALAGLGELKWLSLAGTRVTDLGPLATLKHLTFLGIEHASVEDFSPLTSLPALRTLVVDDAQLARLPKVLRDKAEVYRERCQAPTPLAKGLAFSVRGRRTLEILRSGELRHALPFDRRIIDVRPNPAVPLVMVAVGQATSSDIADCLECCIEALFVVDAEAGTATPWFIPFGPEVSGIQWSPSGKYAAAISPDRERYLIYTAEQMTAGVTEKTVPHRQVTGGLHEDEGFLSFLRWETDDDLRFTAGCCGDEYEYRYNLETDRQERVGCYKGYCMEKEAR